MQLKSLAKTTSALNDVNTILKSTNNDVLTSLDALRIIGSKCSLETLKSAIAQSTLNEQQIESILLANGLQGELLKTTTAELAQITSTNTLSASQVGATTSTLGLGTAFKGLGIAIKNSVKSMLTWIRTTPAGALTAIATAIGSVLTVVNHLEQAEKRESDNAVELYEKSQDKINSNKEEAKSLEELIDKYKELKSKSNMDSDTREQIKNLQYDIVDLVGSEASSLDLVNGRLDEQLDKLKEITNEKSKQNVDDARDNYHKAVHASDVIVGDADKYGNDASIQWNGAESKQIHKVDGFEKMSYNDFVQFIQDSGFEDIFRKNKDENLLNMRFVVDTTGIDELEDKITRLKEFKEFLAENGLRDTELYQSINTAIDKYTKQGDYESSSASNLVDEVIKDFSKSNDELDNITVNSVKSFEEYRQKMIDEVQKDESIGKALADGTLSNEDIEMAVNNFMATIEQFSKWYEQGINTIKVKEILQDQFDEKIGELTLDELKIAAEQIEIPQNTLLTWDELLAKIKDFQDSTQQNTFSSLSDLLNTEDLADTKKELIELAKAGELTPDTFTSTREYTSLLEKTGLTAKQACNEIKKLPELDMDLSDWQTQVQNARSSVSELKDMLDELTSKDSEGLTSSSVDKIISDYPKLLQYLNDTPRLIEEINSLISEQSDIANDAGNMLIEYSSEAYEQMKLSAQDAIEQIMVMQNGQVQSVANMYGIDLNNYASLAQAKKAIEFALLGDLNQGWANHFGIVVDSLTGMAKATENMGEYYNDPENQKKVSQYNNMIKQLNDAKSRFENNVNYGSAGVGKSKSKGSDKKETDKWLEEYKKKLAELQNQLDKGRLMPSTVVIQYV